MKKIFYITLRIIGIVISYYWLYKVLTAQNTSLSYTTKVIFSAFLLITMIVYLKHAAENKLSRIHKGFDVIDAMEGEEFEYYVSELFSVLGYKTKVTASKNDFGADVIAKKDNDVIAIQCKRWKDNVGIEAVYEVVGSMAHYKANKSMVVTNNYFTEAAKDLAKDNKTIMINRNELAKMIDKAVRILSKQNEEAETQET